MLKAPEKIWAMASIDGKWSDGHCSNEKPQINKLTAPFVFEYTRTDISDARVLELEVGLRDVVEVLDGLAAQL
jgi:hypothetical protein